MRLLTASLFLAFSAFITVQAAPVTSSSTSLLPRTDDLISRAPLEPFEEEEDDEEELYEKREALTVKEADAEELAEDLEGEEEYEKRDTLTSEEEELEELEEEEDEE